MAQKEKCEVSFEHIKSTDVIFVDIVTPKEGARISTVDVGEMLGFPGQVLARMDSENEILYGLTIQNATAFKRRLLWKYRMANAKRALALMVASIKAGLRIEERRHAHALRA